ncbi:glycosyltransferase [Oceanobacillus profundus]|uniref:Glycosyltransferase n=1 Tax=Oceanobacillus profundus TaxID=372463 RepID=A0A417YP87_9BACI|nr:glycosyltransferase [Oceanobacillus profundus]RHW35499.1 glycosyltransferase [Oceanobacillus profundus]
MEKKRVLFFIYQMGGGGAARTLLNIINNIDRSKFIPILVTLQYDGSYEKYLDQDVKFIKLKTKRLRSAVLPLAKVIREEKAAIVFSTIPNYNTIAILGNLLSFSGAKNIVREAAFLGGSPAADFKLRLYGLLYKLSSRVIALSHGVKENIVKRYKVKREKINVIYNPVDIERIRINMKEGILPQEHETIFTGSEKVIITAGRLVQDKDQQTLIKAVADVSRRLDVKLVILGEGELEDELKRLADRMDVADKVFFLGFQQNPYVYFAHADVFVLSSKREGFGHVLSEALATGTPVVSTKAYPGAEEVLNDGEYGLMCEIGNAEQLAEKIYETLTWTVNRREQAIQKGLERVNTFRAQTIVKQYEDVFMKTLNKTY